MRSMVNSIEIDFSEIVAKWITVIDRFLNYIMRRVNS